MNVAHLANAIAHCSNQFIGDTDAVRIGLPVGRRTGEQKVAEQGHNAPVSIPQHIKCRDIGNVQPVLNRILGIICRRRGYIRLHSC